MACSTCQCVILEVTVVSGVQYMPVCMILEEKSRIQKPRFLFSAIHSVSVHVWSASDTFTPVFYLCLFYDAVIISGCKASRHTKIMNNEWSGKWKEAFITALSKYRI